MRALATRLQDPVSLLGWRAVAERALALLELPQTRLLLEHWRGLGTPEHPPARRELDPLGFAAALPYIWLQDYLPEGRRLRYRLVGDDVAQRHCGNLLGKHLDETVDDRAIGLVSDYFLACPERPAIVVLRGRLYQEWERSGYGERLLLPLLDPDGTPEGLIGITLCRSVFTKRDAAERAVSRRTVILPLDGAPGSDVAS